MNKIQSIQNDINKLEKSLKLIEQTENYILFNKSVLIFDICESINILKEKQERLKMLITC
jgi:hypothetical protein